MIFERNKKEKPHKGDVFLAKGIYLKEPRINNGHVLANCFLRSLIVFMLVLGSVGGFLSAFDISYNYVLVIVSYLVLSAYFSFLYATSKMIYRDLGYILFFGVFVTAIYIFRIYANSGFYVIVNRVLQYAQSFFNLSGVREYEVQINNPYFTVAIVSVFLGMAEIIILNIWIYSTMSLGWTLLFTFPLLFIPIYMKQMPDMFYIILLCAGYMAVVIFKANGHYLSFAWDASFRVRGLKKDHISYTQDSGIFKQILSKTLLLSFCMVIVAGTVFPNRSFEGMFHDDKLRERTSEVIGNFILLGVGGLYNRYSSTGGMSGGKLGGVSNVRPDYQPDLLVSFTPYGNSAIYLKGYTGGIYGDNQWESIYEYGKDDVEVFEEESLYSEASNLQSQMQNDSDYGAFGKMDIKNVGADPAYLYYPYYTLFDEYTIYKNHSLMPTAQGLKMEEETTYSYYPKIKWEDSWGNVYPSQIDTDKVDKVFLDVPEKNADVIREECERIGINENMTENEIAESIRTYFDDNIPYTLKPGATPESEDFINYFLTKNRKGYCAHFASAATLLFRQMGIPARYVEGYAISMETVLASELNEEKEYWDYYTGYSEIGQSAVVDVEVTDAMAHAWVEIYIEGFGWKVVEVTPGSNESTEEDDFWSAFATLFGGADYGVSGDNPLFGDIQLSKFSWPIYVVIGILLVLWLFRVCCLIYRKICRYRICHQKDMKEALIARYADVCDIIRMYESEYGLCRSHVEQLLFIKDRYCVDFDVKKICRWLECISFSRNIILQEEMEELQQLFIMFRKAIWKQTGVRQKIKWLKR